MSRFAVVILRPNTVAFSVRLSEGHVYAGSEPCYPPGSRSDEGYHSKPGLTEAWNRVALVLDKFDVTSTELVDDRRTG